MKIDKKQSLKNKIGVVAVSLVLSGALMPSTALAENFNYMDEKTKVDFIYDDDHVGRGSIDVGTYELVIITNLETGNSTLISFEQLDEELKRQTDDVLMIDNKEFCMESVLTARNNLQEKIEEEEARKVREGKIILSFFTVVGAIPFVVRVFERSGCVLKEFVYNIRRGFQEDKSRRKFAKHVKIK